MCNREVLLSSQLGKAVTIFTDALTRKQCIKKTFQVFCKRQTEQWLSLACSVLLKNLLCDKSGREGHPPAEQPLSLWCSWETQLRT